METRIRLFEHSANAHSFHAGATIFEQGACGDTMYIIVDGQVDIVRDGHLVDTLGAGLVFGETALLEATQRNAAAVARTACKVVPLDMKAFLFLVDNNRNFALDIMRVLAERLEKQS